MASLEPDLKRIEPLVRQLLIESIVLSFIGGTCGVLFAIWMTRGLLSLVPTEGNPLLLRAAPIRGPR